MLRTLKDLFDSVLSPAAPSESDSQRLQTATAVLLVEVMRAEPTLGPREHAAVVNALRSHFALAQDAVERLVELAQEKARTANDFFQFTSVINDQFDQPTKVRIVEQMWAVAYADGTLDAHENHLIARIAELLYVPHGQYIGAKMRAKEAAGLP